MKVQTTITVPKHLQVLLINGDDSGVYLCTTSGKAEAWISLYSSTICYRRSPCVIAGLVEMLSNLATKHCFVPTSFAAF